MMKVTKLWAGMGILSALLPGIGLLLAGEVAVESGAFRVERKFQAMLLPGEVSTFELTPQVWNEYIVKEILEHGASVNKGDVVVSFERENYDKRREDLTRSIVTEEQEIVRKKAAVADLHAKTERKLKEARRAKENAEFDLKYFEEVTVEAQKRREAHKVETAEFNLAAAKEELKQLKAMYEADDLVEETEEIILERQHFKVKSATLSLEDTKRAVKYALEVAQDRERVKWETALQAAKEALAKAEAELPASLKVAELELEGLETKLKRSKLEQERLKSDGSLLEWKAPRDGVVFYGRVKRGAWVAGESSKNLAVGNQPPKKRLILAVLGDGEKGGTTTAWLDAAVANGLQAGQAAWVEDGKGAWLKGEVGEVAAVPSLDGKYRVSLSVEREAGVIPGSWAHCRVVVRDEAEGVLTVPDNALSLGADGWEVEVKLADGTAERRKVQVGASNGELREIRSGLEAGQVVKIPD